MVFLNYILMCMIFGTTFLAIKIGVDAGAPPFLSAGLRFFCAGLFLFMFMVWRKKVTFRLLVQKEMLLTGIGLTFGTFSTLYWAEQHVTSGIAAILSATGPIMIVIIQTILFKQSTNHLSLIGCFIGIIGVILLILPSISFEVSHFWLFGSLGIIVGQIFFATGTIYSKSVIKKFRTTSPIALNAAQMIHGGGLLFLFSLFIEDISFSAIINPASISSLIYLMVIGSMVGHSLYYWLVSKTNTVFPSTWLYISPLLAIGLGVSFYQEDLSWLTGIGAIIIVIGTLLVNIETLLKRFSGKGRVSQRLKTPS